MKKYFQKKVDTAKRVVGLSELKQNTDYIKSFAQDLWAEKGKTSETVESVSVEKLKLSDKQLFETKSTWQRLVVLFMVCAVLAILYAIFNLINGYYGSLIVSLALVVLFLAQTFKYHFWLFQLKQGKLGCTWQEWSQQLFKSGESK